MSTTTSSPVRLNPDHHQYVIHAGDGYSCLGYNNARDHANQIARLMNRPDLAFGDDDYATLDGYWKYQAAVAAWGHSPFTMRTYFDPHTEPAVRRVLETCRLAHTVVRLILGNRHTGQPWLEEHDVVGTIGRSTGLLKVPLLVPRGEYGGGGILSANVLGIVDWISGKLRYRHPDYHAPELLIQPSDDKRLPWRVLHQGIDVARFDDIGKAGAYVAFMRGATVEPRIFQ
ncbi:hypothetical protein [Xanthomonas arboricola]|uniref:hypothetical protein n=1 Tax=Xanthomonas arboricola TaxID=56448 RepID=UPI000CEDE6A5|nr:hypothetical protein [Xanthomonas arboricola]PPT49352.1 hypothetical protein XarjCFBP7652_09085 [Xanthomonas arboricola]